MGAKSMVSSTATIEADEGVLAFEPVFRKTAPYPHFISPRFYTERFAETLLAWLESGADWRLKETPLFAQYELGFGKFRHCTEIQGLWDPAVLARLRDQAGRAFGVPVSGRINISAHKLITGQHGSIHTDNEPGETHRLVVQLNRGRANDSGGNLVLLSGPTPADMAVVFKQASNSAVGFGLGPASHHAIGRVRTGTRFTVIYTFLSDAATDAKYNYFVAS
jgi:hypothetical protein